jgi:hypothetical protein
MIFIAAAAEGLVLAFNHVSLVASLIYADRDLLPFAVNVDDRVDLWSEEITWT